MTEAPVASLSVLGPLTVRGTGARVLVAGDRQRRAIAALVDAGPGGASSERLAEVVWDDSERPPDPVPHLRTAISRLRKQLTDEGIEAQAVIEGRPGGYRLGARVEVDAWRFEDLLTGGGSNRESVVEHLDEALALWDGDPFDDVGAPAALGPSIARLSEIRLVAEEERLDAWLARGVTRRVLGRGLALVDQYPYRERLYRSTALAAYRLGRQRESLRLLDQHRSFMREEFGLEPGPELTALEQAILDHASSLRGPVTEERNLRGYRLQELIGTSNGVERYLATQLALDRSVVVEIAPEDEIDLHGVKRFHERAGALARLRHPNLVWLVDFWREPGVSYVVTSPPDRTLGDVLAAGPPPFRDRIGWIIEAGSAVESIRVLDMVPGPLDPNSIFLDGEQRIVLDLPPLRASRPASDSDAIATLATLAVELIAGRADAGYAELSAAAVDSAESEQLAEFLLTAKNEAVEGGTVRDFIARVCWHAGVAAPEAIQPKEAANPYPGLVPFDETTATHFHGRDRFVAELVKRWLDPRQRLTVVVGPSGSGKSSVVLAGLVPAIRRQNPEGRSESVVAMMRPGHDPFAALVEAVGNIATEASADLVALVNDDDPLNSLANGALGSDVDLVLVIDQLEELFVGPEPELRDRFLSAIATGTDARLGRVRVVATLRADFFDRALKTQPFASCLPAAVVLLPVLTDVELTDAIVLPARASAVEVEPALVARLIADSGGEVGTLPLLGATLRELFNRRSADRLTAADYDALGGLTAALVSTAERMAEQLSENQLDELRHLFGHLVTVQADHPPVRRRVPLADLVAVGVPAAVVDAAIGARLLVADRDPVTRVMTISVTHESVLVRWPRLARWLDEDRRMLHDRTELADAAAGWDHDGRDDGLLLHGGRLNRARELEKAGLPLGLLEQELVAASEARFEAEQASERRHELRRRRLLVLATVVALVAVFAGAVAIRQQRRADSEAEAARESAAVAAAERDRATAASEEATIRLLQQSAATVFDDRPELSVQLALAAVEKGGFDAERTLIDLLTRPHFESYLGHVEPNVCVSSSPGTTDPALAIVGQADASGTALLSLFDVNAGVQVATVSVPASPAGECPALGPGGSTVAAVRGTELVTLDTPTGTELARRELEFEPDRMIWALDGSAIAVLNGGGSGAVSLLDPDTLKILRTIDLDAPFPIAIALSSITGHLVATSDTRPPLLFDLDADSVRELEDPDTRVWAVEMSVDGQVVVGTDGRRLFSWSAPLNQFMATDLSGEATGRESLTLSPNADQAAILTSRGVELYDLESGEPVDEPIRFVRGLGRVAFVDTNTLVASVGGGRVYRLQTAGAAVDILHDEVEAAIVAADGRAAIVATGTDTRSIVLDPDGPTVDVGGFPASHRPFGDGLTAIYESELKRYRVWRDADIVGETLLNDVIRAGSVNGRSVRIGNGLAVLDMRDRDRGPASLNEIVVLEAATGGILASFHSPGDILAEPLWKDRLLIASIDDTARISTLNGEVVHDLGQFEHPVEAAALAGNGDLLLGLGDGTIRRHDGSSFEFLSSQVGPPSALVSLLPFAGGFVAQHFTGEIVKWRDGEGEPAGTVYVAPLFAGFASVSSDERFVYVPDGERIVSVPLAIDDWIEQACRRVGTDIDARSWEAITGSPPEPLSVCL